MVLKDYESTKSDIDRLLNHNEQLTHKLMESQS